MKELPVEHHHRLHGLECVRVLDHAEAFVPAVLVDVHVNSDYFAR